MQKPSRSYANQAIIWRGELQKCIFIIIWVMHLTIKLRIWQTLEFLKDYPSVPHSWLYLSQYVLFSKATRLICQTHVSTEDVPIGTNIQSDFTLFNAISIQGLISESNVIYATSSYPFGFPTISKRPPVSIIKYIVNVFSLMVTHVL